MHEYTDLLGTFAWHRPVNNIKTLYILYYDLLIPSLLYLFLLIFLIFLPHPPFSPFSPSPSPSVFLPISLPSLSPSAQSSHQSKFNLCSSSISISQVPTEPHPSQTLINLRSSRLHLSYQLSNVDSNSLVGR